MAESIVQVTEGSGKKLHTWSRTIGANTVEDEAVLPAEFHLATYVAVATAVSTATAASHYLQIMAGASLNVAIRRIRLRQRTAATTASTGAIQIFRLTTAGTGGTAVTPRPFDSADAASGATAMTLPTVKGTEGVQLWEETTWMVAATTAFTKDNGFEWINLPNEKSIIIPAGATNGIAIKGGGIAAGQVDIDVEFVERSFV
jgi:hypothetical protein